MKPAIEIMETKTMVRPLVPAFLLLCGISAAHAQIKKTEAPSGAAGSARTTETQALDPAKVVKLTPEQARRLAAAAKATLSLPQLRVLSAESARELATYREESGTCMHTVCVPGTEKREATYTVNVPYEEEVTSANGDKATVRKCRQEQRTRTITIPICRSEQRQHKCPLTLELNGIASTSPKVLEALSQHDGNLHLNGIRTLSHEEAQSVATHKGGALALDGLESIDAVVAKHLSTHEGDLSLDGIRSLSVDTATALCQSKHSVSLDGLTVLTDEVADAFAAIEGSASLKGLKKVSPEAIQQLRNKPISFPPDLLEEPKKENE